MKTVQTWLQFIYLGMIGVSSLLLGSALGDLRFTWFCLIAALLAWLLVDYLKLFHMPQWVANTLAIIVLLFAMWRFMQSDTHGQLTSVAMLLVFLQSVLAFQEKTPRQYWQLAILCFLQIVVATIYSLNFEGGMLFLVYMMLSGLFLWLTCRYDQSWRTSLMGRPSKLPVAKGRGTSNGPKLAPQLEFDLPVDTHRLLATGALHLVSWMFISMAFAVALFVMIPRSEATWFGPKYATPVPLGSSRNMEIRAEGVISLPVETKMRFGLSNPETGDIILLSEPLYLRGMSLGSLVIQNGNTSWQAPHDRLTTESFESMERIRDTSDLVALNVTLEATRDPLLYVPNATFLPEASLAEFDYCHDLSAITRGRNLFRMEVSPFRYDLVVPRSMVRSTGGLPELIAFPDFAPYVPQSKTNKNRAMSDNPLEHRWLTEFPTMRYPTIARIANQVRSQTDEDNHLLLAKNLEQYFQTAGFTYTLDFRDISRNPNVDVVEDFVANFKRGHCELYASSLVLMLRSQGIPARYVVGYYGQEFNELGEFYSVRENFAHAWVEAYIRPEDCSDEMLQFPRIADSGAWVTLDATPYSDDRLSAFARSGQALDLARSIWQGYVLGLDDPQDTQDITSGGIGFSLSSLGSWSDRVQQGVLQIQSRPDIQAAVIGAAIVFLITATVLTARWRKRKSATSAVATAPVWRRLLANTMGLFSPKLRQWLLQSTTTQSQVNFYRRFLGILNQFGWTRSPDSTHREFAAAVMKNLQSAGTNNEFQQIIPAIVEQFHRVRFGNETLDRSQLVMIDRQLDDLQRLLSTTPNVTPVEPSSKKKSK